MWSRVLLRHLLGDGPAAAWTLGSRGDCLLSGTVALLQGCCLLLHALVCTPVQTAGAGAAIPAA